MWGRFSRRTFVPLVGIDLGSHYIKALTLVGDAEHFTISAIASWPTPLASIRDNQIQDIDRVAFSLRELRSQLALRKAHIVSAVNGTQVIHKIIDVALGLSPEALETQVWLQAQQMIPFALDEVCLDYQLLPTDGAASTQQPVLLCACRRSYVESHMAAFTQAGFETKIVDLAVQALLRAVLACQPTLKQSKAPIAIVDLGAHSMTFVVAQQQQVIYSRTQPLNSDDELNLQPALSSSANFMANPRAKWLGGDSLGQLIERQVQLFCHNSEYPELPYMVLTGGGSVNAFASLKQSLSQTLLHPDPLTLFAAPALQDNASHGASYMLALGLALRCFTPWPM